MDAILALKLIYIVLGINAAAIIVLVAYMIRDVMASKKHLRKIAK